ncbi:Z-ring-associated protein ZapA [hydrothermal vent metagenome]|uniref:Cell division protein ZapA n=1 Tax=hydrothermal vent metagenome TaxID=652676 RepID=A0A3B1ASI2_9ZZZZ
MSVKPTPPTENKVISIRVLDKEYQVACPVEEESALLESARLLDEKMREIRNARKMVGADRVAVMAALNLAHDLLQLKSNSDNDEPVLDTKLRSLQNKVDAAIVRGRQLGL